jgi:hypothetical protein
MGVQYAAGAAVAPRRVSWSLIPPGQCCLVGYCADGEEPG